MKISLLLLSLFFVVTLSACSEQAEEGSLEEMGKKMDAKLDSATDYAGKKMQEIGENIEQKGQDIEDKE